MQFRVQTFCIIDAPFTATEHLFIFMNFTIFQFVPLASLFTVLPCRICANTICVKAKGEHVRAIAQTVDKATNAIFLMAVHFQTGFIVRLLTCVYFRLHRESNRFTIQKVFSKIQFVFAILLV